MNCGAELAVKVSVSSFVLFHSVVIEDAMLLLLLLL
jgi:hypothetical protein